MDREEKTVGTIADPGSIGSIRVSPDESLAAYRKDAYTAAGDDLWVIDFKRGTSTRFTFGAGGSEFPVFSPIAKNWCSRGREATFGTCTGSRRMARARKRFCSNRRSTNGL